MRILVTGANGQVGQALCRLGSGHELLALDRETLDITDADAISRMLHEQCPQVLINAAAYTAVDRAEAEPDQAFAVNRDGPAALARACAELAIPLFHISTDYVFDGTLAGAYREDHPASPLGVYGQSKWAGEERIRDILPRHLILRTSWVFGLEGHNFVRTMLRLGREREELGIVDDQRGCPTFADHIAGVLLDLAARSAGDELHWGTYHYCDTPETTWYGFARAIFEAAGQRQGLVLRDLRPIATAEYPTLARRPANSVLDCQRLADHYGITPRPWVSGLARLVALG